MCMGGCITRGKRPEEVITQKKGYRYAEYADQIKPLDLVLFRGGDFVSGFIRFLQKRNLPAESSAGYDVGAGAFSHVGMIVTSEILDDDRLEEGKLYVWESTMSGRLADGVYNIDGESFLGVQLRSFDEVLPAYDEDPDTRIAVSHVFREVYDSVWGELPQTLLRNKFTKLFKKYNGVRYDANFLSLGSSICPCLRPARGTVEDVLDTEDWLFCSELVATVYQDLGLFDEDVNPKNVVPSDFLGYDADSEDSGGIPVIVGGPVYIVSERWWDGVTHPPSPDASDEYSSSDNSILTLTSTSSPRVKGESKHKKDESRK